MILFNLLLAMQLETTTLTQIADKQKIYDKYGKYKGQITQGKFYNPYGKFQWKITQDGKIFDPYGKYMGKIKK